MEGQETEAPSIILYSPGGVSGTIVGEPDTRKEARGSGPVLGHYEVPILVTQVVRRAAGTRVGCTFKGHCFRWSLDRSATVHYRSSRLGVHMA